MSRINNKGVQYAICMVVYETANIVRESSFYMLFDGFHYHSPERTEEWNRLVPLLASHIFMHHFHNYIDENAKPCKLCL